MSCLTHLMSINWFSLKMTNSQSQGKKEMQIGDTNAYVSNLFKTVRVINFFYTVGRGGNQHRRCVCVARVNHQFFCFVHISILC